LTNAEQNLQRRALEPHTPAKNECESHCQLGTSKHIGKAWTWKASRGRSAQSRAHCGPGERSNLAKSKRCTDTCAEHECQQSFPTPVVHTL